MYHLVSSVQTVVYDICMSNMNTNVINVNKCTRTSCLFHKAIFFTIEVLQIIRNKQVIYNVGLFFSEILCYNNMYNNFGQQK